MNYRRLFESLLDDIAIGVRYIDIDNNVVSENFEINDLKSFKYKEALHWHIEEASVGNYTHVLLTSPTTIDSGSELIESIINSSDPKKNVNIIVSVYTYDTGVYLRTLYDIKLGRIVLCLCDKESIITGTIIDSELPIELYDADERKD